MMGFFFWRASTRWLRHVVMLAVLLIVVLLGMLSCPIQAWAEDSSLPTRVWQLPDADSQGNSINVLLPDWSQISFSGMPPIANSGSIDGKAWESMLGYDLSRTWQPGMTPDQYLKMGDISQALHAEAFSLDGISSLLGVDLHNTALSEFALAGVQTLQHLVDIVPGLGELSVDQVPPIQALLEAKFPGAGPAAGGQTGNTLHDLVATNPAIAELQLGEIDLSAFSIGDIPNLSTVELQQFQEWGNAFLQEIPGLGQVPLSDFPNPVAEIGSIVMRIDMIYGAAENKRQHTISGSYQQGFAVPCLETSCGYIELDDLENTGRKVRGSLEGKQWISGKYQEVEGGFGALGNVNGGKEPTGRHPFGEAFKVVVMEPDETTDSVNTALFFRFCDRYPIDLGCTPYFIGPVPFFSYRINAPIFVGQLEMLQPSSESSLPTGTVRHEQGKYDGNLTPDPDCFQSGDSSPTQTVNLNHLADAIAGLESEGSGGYQAIGVYTCADGGRNCGRALGRYQFMSYNAYASGLIAARSGGQQFLDKVNRGYQPTQEEVLQYFPPEDQDKAFRGSMSELTQQASQQIDPTTGKLFGGDRLVERVAQMHFGGAASQIDGSGSDVLGRLSLSDYVKEAAKRYRTLGSGSNQVCVPTVSSIGGKHQNSAGIVPVALLFLIGMSTISQNRSSRRVQLIGWFLLGLSPILRFLIIH